MKQVLGSNPADVTAPFLGQNLQLGVSVFSINYLNINEKKNGIRKKIGRPKKLGRHDKLKIKKYVIAQLNEGKIVSTNDVKENLELKESLNTIRRELNTMGFYFDYCCKYKLVCYRLFI